MNCNIDLFDSESVIFSKVKSKRTFDHQEFSQICILSSQEMAPDILCEVKWPYMARRSYLGKFGGSAYVDGVTVESDILEDVYFFIIMRKLEEVNYDMSWN